MQVGYLDLRDLFVYSETVIRCTPIRREIDTTLSPFARAVLIASTWLSVRGVLVRLLGFATTTGSPLASPYGSSSIPSFACCHAELSRSNLCQVFGLSPPASTTCDESGRRSSMARVTVHRSRARPSAGLSFGVPPVAGLRHPGRAVWSPSVVA